MMDQEWRDEVACGDMPVGTFYPTTADGLATMHWVASNVCLVACPVREECYRTGMTQRPQERQGWWGGVDVEVEFRRRKRIA